MLKKVFNEIINNKNKILNSEFREVILENKSEFIKNVMESRELWEDDDFVIIGFYLNVLIMLSMVAWEKN